MGCDVHALGRDGQAIAFSCGHGDGVDAQTDAALSGSVSAEGEVPSGALSQAVDEPFSLGLESGVTTHHGALCKAVVALLLCDVLGKGQDVGYTLRLGARE